jgi:hypothetical protein
MSRGLSLVYYVRAYNYVPYIIFCVYINAAIVHRAQTREHTHEKFQIVEFE